MIRKLSTSWLTIIALALLVISFARRRLRSGTTRSLERPRAEA